MKTKILNCLLAATLVLGACSKEQPQPSVATTPTTLKYKISPNKLTELRDLHVALKSGQNLRISEETFTEEEFYLYAEALINSMLTNFESEVEQTAERNLQVDFRGDSYSLSALLQYLQDLETAIQNDLQSVAFEGNHESSPFVHLIDIDWENAGAIHYIAAINSALPASPQTTFNMTNTVNGACTNMALNGYLQTLIINNWNLDPNTPLNYRPNVLFNPAWNPNCTANYIPAYTFTEVTTRTIDYADPLDRHLYFRAGINFDWFWHRVVQGANTLPSCLPDNTVGGNLTWYSFAAANRGLVFNPHQYQFYDQNGLVIIGFTIEPKKESSRMLGYNNAPEDQYEWWHKVTYSYGRQIIIGEPPIGND